MPQEDTLDLWMPSIFWIKLLQNWKSKSAVILTIKQKSTRDGQIKFRNGKYIIECSKEWRKTEPWHSYSEMITSTEIRVYPKRRAKWWTTNGWPTKRHQGEMHFDWTRPIARAASSAFADARRQISITTAQYAMGPWYRKTHCLAERPESPFTQKPSED